MAVPTLSLIGLRLAFSGQAPLIANLTIDLPPGLIVLRGDSGTGKTSLMRILAGELDRAAGWSGTLLLDQQPWPAPAQGAKPRAFWREVWADADSDVTPQQLQQGWQRDHPGWDGAAWLDHVVGFGLGPHLHKPMLALSAGSRRKLGLAAGLASGAALTLLDEPTAGLDAPSVAYLVQAVTSAGRPGNRWIWLTQDGGLPPLSGALVLDLPGGSVAGPALAG